MSVKNQNGLANSLDPDETAHNEPSHQDLHCLHRYLAWSAGPQRLRISYLHHCRVTLTGSFPSDIVVKALNVPFLKGF